MDRRRATGIALVLTAAVSFGSASVLARPVYDTGMGWQGLVTWRFLIGAGLAWIWVATSAHRRTAVRRLSRRQVAVTIALGALFTGNAGTYYAALETVPVALAGVLVYTYPVIVAVLSVRFATRLPGRRPWAALALALAGVVLALGGVDLTTATPIDGIVLVMLSSVIYSIWIIASARLSGERHDRLGHEAAGPAGLTGDAAATTAIMITSSAIVFSLSSVATGGSVNPMDVPEAAWPGIVAIGFLASFLAIQAFYAGARRIGAAQAALLSTIEPLTIVALAWIVLGQRLEPIQLVGAVLIMVSVVVAQTTPRPRGAPEPAMPLDAEAPAEGDRA
ncbi:MAG: DMT family transporter [Candidatus Limnocylindrales bacterium]|nr:DMT family transporter [Candidatus Limnocylindrales bacterium]